MENTINIQQSVIDYEISKNTKMGLKLFLQKLGFLNKTTTIQDFSPNEQALLTAMNGLLKDQQSTILTSDGLNRKITVFNSDKSIIMIADRSQYIFRTVDGSIIYDIRMSQKLSEFIYRTIMLEKEKRYNSLIQEVENRVFVNLTELNKKIALSEVSA